MSSQTIGLVDVMGNKDPVERPSYYYVERYEHTK